MKGTTFRAFHAVEGNCVRAGTAFVDKCKTLDHAAKALMSQHSVDTLPSGRLVFVDKTGRPVSLYLRLDPEQTDKGREILAARINGESF